MSLGDFSDFSAFPVLDNDYFGRSRSRSRTQANKRTQEQEQEQEYFG